MTIQEAIQRVTHRKHLTQKAAYKLTLQIMEGKATDAQIGGLLVGLAMKGETINEIIGFVRAMREKATLVPVTGDDVVDTCGTGGDLRGTFNISTASALVAAGAGCRVAKHGNRSVSSRSGSADTLQELGVNFDLSIEELTRCLQEIGFVFMFAPQLHQAMKYAIGPRREIGIRTIFNILGPLTNPAGVKRQILGVFDADLTEPLAEVLLELGAIHCLIVHSADGLDEISICDRTKVTELKDDDIETYYLSPGEFGLQRRSIDAIRGGDAPANAEIILNILNGHKGAPRDIVLMNAGAAIYVAGKAESIHRGIELAAHSIDSGQARQTLEKLRQFTNPRKYPLV